MSRVSNMELKEHAEFIEGVIATYTNRPEYAVYSGTATAGQATNHEVFTVPEGAKYILRAVLASIDTTVTDTAVSVYVDIDPYTFILVPDGANEADRQSGSTVARWSGWLYLPSGATVRVKVNNPDTADHSVRVLLALEEVKW